MRDAHRMDEDDVRSRARGGSRRRTRDRPGFEQALPALVTTVDRGRCTCRLDDGTAVNAIRGADVRRTAVVVGDRVDLTGDITGRTDTLARIVRRAPRVTVLRRSPDDTDPAERPVVANAQILVAVVALADPPPRTRMIDRVLVAAYDGGLTPVLCLTKADLADPADLMRSYEPLGLTVIALQPDADLAPLQGLLHGQTSVMFGHSGVGKSTLVNRLVPDAHRAIGHVNDVTGRGRHTSSSVILFDLPGGGHVIDTPGVRSFGLGLLSPARVLAAFPDLREGAEQCPPRCGHGVEDPDCHLDTWVAQGNADAARLDSLRRLLASRESDEA
jgi:ribosome biogenesis GTPase